MYILLYNYLSHRYREKLNAEYHDNLGSYGHNCVGIRIKGGIFDILIDSREKINLFQFQLTLWTWMFVSSFLATAFARKTVEVELAPELWALMGISVKSTAGAVIVKGAKSGTKPDASRVKEQSMKLNRSGVLKTNSATSEARLIDMFKGEEITDADYVDISKVQMFFFTIVVWLGYIFMLLAKPILPNAEGIVIYPTLTASMITMIGISHAGYLTIKAAPKTPAEQ